MRAFSDNKELALLSGINPDKVVQITWLLVAVLTTIAGTLYGLDKGFAPQQYHLLLLPIFASVIVGGIGSPVGAIAGAFLISFSEVLLTYAYKKFLIYLLPLSMHPSPRRCPCPCRPASASGSRFPLPRPEPPRWPTCRTPPSLLP